MKVTDSHCWGSLEVVLIPEAPSHKDWLLRVLLVYTINISSNIIITSTSSFELA